jgi:hypothetical protein
MRYEKPNVIELNARARAAGQGPLACVDGSAAGGADETCGVGSSAGFTCSPGTSGAAGATCYAGSSPSGGFEDCLSGTSAYYCEAGAGGNDDPFGCRSGPVP